MSLRNRCTMLVTCLALTAGAGIGCAAPEAPAHPTVGKVVTGVVVHAKASPATQAKLGITRWHGIVEKDTGAIVMDGSDAKGKVRFVTAIRVDKKENVFYLDMHAPSKGSLAVDLGTGTILSSTLSATQLETFATLMSSDWDKHMSQTQYGTWGAVAATLTAVSIGAGVVVTVAVAVAAAPVIATAAGVVGVAAATGALITGIVEMKNNDADTAKLQSDMKQLQQDVKDMKDAQTKPADPAKDPAADPAKDPTADPAKDPAADPAKDPAADPTTDTAQATNLPPTDAGGDLDKGGGLDTTPASGTTGGDTTGGGTTGGDTTGGGTTGGGTTGGDTTGGGGGTTGGDTTGGGSDTTGGDTTGGEFAVGTCRKAATSKTTKVRACTHY